MGKGGGPETTRLGVIEIDHPGYKTMSGEVAMPLFDGVPTLDEVAMQMHELVHDLIEAIRKEGPQ